MVLEDERQHQAEHLLAVVMEEAMVGNLVEALVGTGVADGEVLETWQNLSMEQFYLF